MNTGRSNSGAGHFKSLQILDELSTNDSLTQRDLSSRLGLALGLVNSYIKNLVAKGFITVKSIPPKRYAYYLTPKGFAEKTRLTYDLLHDYTRIYREARSNLKQLFSEMKNEGVRKVAFAGADEIAEIAYITLHEMNMKLAIVVDNEKVGQTFFGRTIQPFQELNEIKYDCIIVTSYLHRHNIYNDLLAQKVKKTAVKLIFAL
jgi:DNA-binding MarR family transcriptional regulator